jgi:hypothetical protein
MPCWIRLGCDYNRVKEGCSAAAGDGIVKLLRGHSLCTYGGWAGLDYDGVAEDAWQQQQ